MHCQCFTLTNVANNLLSYMAVNPGVAAIFVVLDSNADDKRSSLVTMRKLLRRQINLHAIIITDITDSETSKLFSEFVGGDETRICRVPKSGEALSGLLCVVPLQRLAFDTTIALGYNPDRPRNLAKELTTQ